jgi:hypothetical protein
VRVLPAAVPLMDQARARKHDTGLGNRLTDPAFGLLSRDAVLTVIGLQNAGKRPDCGTPAREQVIDLARAEDAGIGAVILIRDHEYVCEGRGARRVGGDPAAPGESHRRNARYGPHGAGGGLRGVEDEQA